MATEPIEFRFRKVRHGCDSALAAYHKWASGSLWGDAIVRSDCSVHVYGLWRRDWTPVWLSITKDEILVAVPVQAIRFR